MNKELVIGFYCLFAAIGCVKSSSPSAPPATAPSEPCPANNLPMKETAPNLHADSLSFIQSNLQSASGEMDRSSIRATEINLSSLPFDEQLVFLALMAKSGTALASLRTVNRLMIQLQFLDNKTERLTLLGKIRTISDKPSFNLAELKTLL